MLLYAMLISGILAHNWLFSPSRAQGGGSVEQPAPTKPLKKISHIQAAAGQEFQIEWSTGHPGTMYYFVVVKAEDEGKISAHTSGNFWTRLDAYLEGCPTGADPFGSDDRFERLHVVPDYYGEAQTTMWNQMDTTLPEQTTNRPDIVGPNDDHYGEKIFPGDRLHIERPESWENDVAYPGAQQFRYKPENLTNDAHCQYSNADLSYIISVHRYKITAADTAAHEWDVARFRIDDVVPGEYIVHMLWESYRDIIDVDILSGTQVQDVYGSTGDLVWVKQEHCQWTNMMAQMSACPLYDSTVRDASWCTSQSSGVGLDGVNVVPVFNPTCKIYVNQEDCEVHKCMWKPAENKCGPRIQSKFNPVWVSWRSGYHDWLGDINERMANNPHRIFRKVHQLGAAEAQELYYRRIVNDNYDFNALAGPWVVDANNRVNVHFEIYTSLQDLYAGRNKWTNCPDGVYAGGFPGACGKYISLAAHELPQYELSYMESNEIKDVVNIYSTQTDRPASCKTTFVDYRYYNGSDYSCGGQSPDGCWCDTECEVRGDCCSDYQDFCAGTPIGQQCQPNSDDCNANAFCGTIEGRNYCMEICRAKNGDQYLDRTDNPYCAYTPHSHPWDAQINERKPWKYLGCHQFGGLTDWVSGEYEPFSYTPRKCFLQCKPRGYKYMSLMGGGQCHCGNEILTSSIDETWCAECAVQDAGEACGGAGIIGIFDITTDCPPEFQYFGTQSNFVSENVCWATAAGSNSGSACDNWCVPPEFLGEAGVQSLLSSCPGNVCNYFREQHALGDYLGGYVREGTGCDRAQQRQYAIDGVEDLMVCFGGLVQDPVGFYNIEAQDRMTVIDDDPEDPIFYSTCFKKEFDRTFSNGFVSAQQPVVIDWRAGDRCLTCDSLNETTIAANGEMTVSWWDTTGSCQECL